MMMMMMMKMMKNPMVLVTCSVLLSSLTVLAYQSSYEPDQCCFLFFPDPLLKRRVVSYTLMDSLCPKKGVMFRMVTDAKICVDPSVDWVQKIMEAKDRAQVAKAKSPNNSN